MPTISMFYGVVIRMFYDDHPPPHFHVQYAEWKAEIAIETLAILNGRLPRRALALALEWAEFHREELREDWNLCREHQQPKKIQPLE